jgi:ABC-type oligopeptide transport system substrate-binding subunit
MGPIIWDQCKVRDEYTVEMKFEKPYRVFENQLIYLLSKKFAESLPEGWKDMGWYKPVGSGPYKVDELYPKMSLS